MAKPQRIAAPEIVTMRVSDIVLDYSIYPRMSVDQYHVGALAKALRAGAVLPPVVLDQRSHRVADGFHRVMATRRVFGPEADVRVEPHSYGSDAEMFADATRRNTAHGLRLSTIDQRHVIVRGRELGLADDAIAAAIGITVSDVLAAEARGIAKDESGRDVVVKVRTKEVVAPKPSIEFADASSVRQFKPRDKPTLSAETLAADAKSDGRSLAYHARQIMIVLNAGLGDSTADADWLALRELLALLSVTVQRRSA